MKLGLVVNNVDTEVPPAATTVIAHSAYLMGHTVYMIGVGDLTYRSRGGSAALARTPPPPGLATQEEFLAAVQGRAAGRTDVPIASLDLLWLRYNPVEESGDRLWERDAGIAFGQLALQEGVIVLNHPYTLSYTVNKMYLEHLPESVRPRTIITRRLDAIRQFYEEQNQAIVLKPAHGYGGKDVFLLKGDTTNLAQIVESIGRTTYVIAQEYIEAAAAGDTRLFLVNGKPLVCEGRVAALRRVSETGDFRSNMTAGGVPKKAEVSERMLEIAELVGPSLIEAGLFFTGLDIVGDLLVEINTISTGGLNAASRLEGVPFGVEVVQALERKVARRARLGPTFDNRVLATLD
jgi:glutathione synthase